MQFNMFDTNNTTPQHMCTRYKIDSAGRSRYELEVFDMSADGDWCRQAQASAAHMVQVVEDMVDSTPSMEGGEFWDFQDVINEFRKMADELEQANKDRIRWLWG